MPEGCNIILNSYLSSNGMSAGAADFEITMNYALFLRAHRHNPGKKGRAFVVDLKLMS